MSGHLAESLVQGRPGEHIFKEEKTPSIRDWATGMNWQTRLSARNFDEEGSLSLSWRQLTKKSRLRILKRLDQFRALPFEAAGTSTSLPAS